MSKIGIHSWEKRNAHVQVLMAVNHICFMFNTKRKRQWTLLINRIEMHTNFVKLIYEICENGAISNVTHAEKF